MSSGPTVASIIVPVLCIISSHSVNYGIILTAIIGLNHFHHHITTVITDATSTSETSIILIGVRLLTRLYVCTHVRMCLCVCKQ